MHFIYQLTLILIKSIIFMLLKVKVFLDQQLKGHQMSLRMLESTKKDFQQALIL